MQSTESDALTQQVRALVEAVDGLSDEEFLLPSRCDGWSVAELVAHCEGMLIRLVGANAQPVEGEVEIDRVGYYRYDPNGPREGEDSDRTFSEVIRDRVIEEVAGRTPQELKAALRESADCAISGLADVPLDRVIKRSGHPRMTFGEFVASRNLEFGVHTMDIAHATRRKETVETPCVHIITEILDRLLGEAPPSTLGWDPVTYILVATGRRPLDAQATAALGPLEARFPLLR